MMTLNGTHKKREQVMYTCSLIPQNKRHDMSKRNIFETIAFVSTIVALQIAAANFML